MTDNSDNSTKEKAEIMQNIVTLTGKENELMNEALYLFTRQVMKFIPIQNEAWGVIAKLTTKLQRRSLYHPMYADFSMELKILSAMIAEEHKREVLKNE